MALSDLISTTAILAGGPDTTKSDLIRELLLHLAGEGHLSTADVPEVLNAVMLRESIGTTGIGNGVAVPHAKHVGVVRSVGILALCRSAVDFDSIDGRPVDIVVLLLEPRKEPVDRRRREWGMKLIKMLSDPASLAQFRSARDAEHLLQLVQVK